MIHYSKDILLNSKNEYNANCLARVKVDESKYEQKNRERMEAIEEAKEKEAWSKFKNKKAGFRKRKDKEDIPDEIPKAKKPRMEQVEYTEITNVGDWLGRMEEICLRAGKLRSYLEMDKLRMLRRMETLEEDRILTNIQSMWEEKLPCVWKVQDEDPILDGGKPSGAGYPVTTPHSRNPGEGGGDAELQPGEGGGDDQPQQDIHTPPTRRRKLAIKTARKDMPSTWWESLVGLVGWWRRVELEKMKLEIMRRKLYGDRRKQ